MNDNLASDIVQSLLRLFNASLYLPTDGCVMDGFAIDESYGKRNSQGKTACICAHLTASSLSLYSLPKLHQAFFLPKLNFKRENMAHRQDIDCVHSYCLIFV